MDKRIVHQVFEKVAAHFPEHIAVEHAGHSLSYAQLNKQADVLAQTLRANGIGHQTLVGIFMPTGLEYLVSILGIAKAGCIFVPLTVDFPKQRLTTLLDHTRPKVILTDMNNSNLLKERYYLDPELTAQRFIQNPLNPDAADIIYCTGDQGRYRPDRSVEFLGREDGQIKRHGIRVEILEIEQAPMEASAGNYDSAARIVSHQLYLSGQPALSANQIPPPSGGRLGGGNFEIY